MILQNIRGICMVNLSTETITFHMSVEFKEKVILLKDEIEVVLSTIYNEAIKNFSHERFVEKLGSSDSSLLAMKHLTITKTLNPLYRLEK